MRLTVEKDGEALARYRHLRGDRAPRGRGCRVRCPDSSRTCSRPRGHRGPHAAHGWFRRILAVWDSGSGAPPRAAGDRPTPPGRKGRRPGARRPVGLRAGRPTGFLDGVWRRLARTFSSVEEVALLILFVAFVWFAVDWLLLMLG